MRLVEVLEYKTIAGVSSSDDEVVLSSDVGVTSVASMIVFVVDETKSSGAVDSHARTWLSMIRIITSALPLFLNSRFTPLIV